MQAEDKTALDRLRRLFPNETEPTPVWQWLAGGIVVGVFLGALLCLMVIQAGR